MRFSSTLPKTYNPTCLFVVWVPMVDGTIHKGEWAFPSLEAMHADLREQMKTHPDVGVPPWQLAMFYVGEDLIAVGYPEWVPEQDPKLKSPKQLEWEGLSDEERTARGRARLQALLGEKLYDPSKLSITFGGVVLSPEGAADADYHSLDGATGRRVRRVSLESRGYVTEPGGVERQETDEEFAAYQRERLGTLGHT